MNLDDAADELYALLPDEFVEARNALAKQAKSAGAGDVAARIKALRKPTLAAWLANQLARRHESGVAGLAELGEQMRRAMSATDGARLRELTGQRKEQVDALLGTARELAREAGQKPSEEMLGTVGETLQAAVADPRAAELLRAGRLTHGLQHVGFGVVEDDDEPAEVISLSEARVARGQRLEASRRPRTGGRRTAEPETEDETEDEAAETADGDAGDRAGDAAYTGEGSDELVAAEQALEQATTAVDEAEEQVDDAEAALDERRRLLETAQATVERLTEELAAARRQLEKARDDVEAAEDDVDTARREAEAARRRRRAARQRLSWSS